MSRVNPTPASRSKFDEGRLMKVLVAPIVSEKATHVADKTNAVTFKVLQDATKPEIKAAVELMFKVEVKGVSVRQHQGQDQALRPLDGPPRQHSQGLRDAQARSRAEPRRGGRVNHGSHQDETDFARPSRHGEDLA